MKSKVILGLLLLLIPIIAYAQLPKKLVIPDNVKKIQVDSWTKDGVKIFSYQLDVKPGQVFEVTPK
jgi:hypothetical protein